MASHSDSQSEAEFEEIEYLEVASTEPETPLQFLPDTNDKVILRKFISKFESMPVLWDTTSPTYANSQLRYKALAKLLEIYRQMKPNATLDDTRKKINSLRSNYRKELRKIESTKRTAEREEDVYKPKSWVFYALQFLNKALKPLSETPNKSNDKEDSQDPPPKKIKTVAVSLSKNNVLKSPQFSPQDYDTPLKFRSSASTQSESIDIPRQTYTTPSTVPTTVNPTALYWSHKLDDINDPIQKIYAEKYVNEILFEAQLGNLTGSLSANIISSDSRSILSPSRTSEDVKKSGRSNMRMQSYSP